MTLVALSFENGQFLCTADTRISNRGKVSADAYSKAFIVPVRVEIVRTDKINYCELKYKIGIAFASGSIIFAQSCVNLISNFLYNINQESETSEPIRFETIAFFSHNVVVNIFEEMRYRLNELGFEIILFGYCPRYNTPCIYSISTELVDGVVQVRTEILSVIEGGIWVIGSGRQAFEASLATKFPPFYGKVSVADQVFNAVQSGIDGGTGGGVTVLMLTKKLARLYPVMSPSSSSKTEIRVTVSLSGMILNESLNLLEYSQQKFNDGQGFSVGSYVFGVGMGLVNTNTGLIRLGESVSFSTSVSKRNAVYLHNLLEVSYGLDVSQDLLGSAMRIEPIGLRKLSGGNSDNVFYGFLCPTCMSVVRIFPAPNLPKKKKPFMNGRLNCHCKKCSNDCDVDVSVVE